MVSSYLKLPSYWVTLCSFLVFLVPLRRIIIFFLLLFPPLSSYHFLVQWSMIEFSWSCLGVIFGCRFWVWVRRKVPFVDMEAWAFQGGPNPRSSLEGGPTLSMSLREHPKWSKFKARSEGRFLTLWLICGCLEGASVWVQSGGGFPSRGRVWRGHPSGVPIWGWARRGVSIIEIDVWVSQGGPSLSPSLEQGSQFEHECEGAS